MGWVQAVTVSMQRSTGKFKCKPAAAGGTKASSPDSLDNPLCPVRAQRRCEMRHDDRCLAQPRLSGRACEIVKIAQALAVVTITAAMCVCSRVGSMRPQSMGFAPVTRHVRRGAALCQRVAQQVTATIAAKNNDALSTDVLHIRRSDSGCHHSGPKRNCNWP